MAFNDDFFNNEIEIGTDESVFNEEIKQPNTPPAEEKPEEKDTNIAEESIDTEKLFIDPERVSDEDEIEGGDTAKDKTVSPKTSIYSSFANALLEDNVLTTINSDDIKDVKGPEEFAEMMEKEVNNRLDEVQRRIKEALEYGIEPQAVKQYEGTLNYLSGITEDLLSDESDEASLLRKKLIMQDFINRGFSKERAEREVTKSFNAGTDQEDAKDSLESNRKYFKEQYDALINEGKEEVEAEKKKAKQVKDDLQKLFVSDKAPFEGVNLDKTTRQKVYDSISKPVHQDEDGNKYTAIQKYEMDHKAEFMYKLGVLFTLTDGFKNVDKLVKKQAAKETKSKLREVEATFQGNRFNGGGLSLLGGIEDTNDEDSRIGLKLNI